MFRRRRPTEERDRGYLDGGIAEFCFFESGLDSRLRENDGCPAPHLWIADQVRNDVIGVVLLSPQPWIADQVCNGMCGAFPSLWILP